MAEDSVKRTRNSWTNMRQRCLNPNNPKYKYYGGRGITISERWNIFANFLEDMGYPPTGMTLDRINPDGNYEPDNCRWATRKQQARNIRDFVGKAGYRGVTKNPQASWRAQICINDKIIWLGNFKNLKDAVKARKEAEIKYNFYG
jgi:hypothetical protein